jgi:hypothetical protein
VYMHVDDQHRLCLRSPSYCFSLAA